MKLDWGSIADWVSGLGSFAAVITALYLAKRRVKLEGCCGLRKVADHEGVQPNDLFWIQVTNTGERVAVIKSIHEPISKLPDQYQERMAAGRP